ncbi:MAG: hypothetical protein RIS47_2262, partial [Bacteroidota bacterium]
HKLLLLKNERIEEQNEYLKEYQEELIAQNAELYAQQEEIEAQSDLIMAQHDRINYQNTEIHQGLSYARRIQKSIMPKETKLLEFFPKSFLLFEPKDILSGDFFWTSALASKRIVAVADCTGHGVPGAMLSMLGMASLNEIVLNSLNTEPGFILEKLRRRVIRSLQYAQEQSVTHDGMDIALCVFDTSNNTVQYAGAYNSLIHVCNGIFMEYFADRMPIGTHNGKLPPFTTQTIQYHSGDVFYLFSDGYADQFGGPDSKKFKKTAFKNYLFEIHQHPMQDQKELLGHTFHTWRGDREQIDDVTVVGIRI